MTTIILDPLITLRNAISKGLEPKLFSASGEPVTPNELAKAETLQIPINGSEPGSFALKSLTRYESKTPSKIQLQLRAVYNCWLTRDLKVADYIKVSDEREIFNLKFVERADLLSWLRGDSSESDNILKAGGERKTVSFLGSAQAEKTSKASSIVEKRPPNPELEKIYEKERALQNHNSVLRGTKSIDFTMVSKECQKSIIMAFKSKHQQQQKQPQHSSSSGARRNRSGELIDSVTKSSSSSVRAKDPIILISPSASALLNMSNIKPFLEDAQFLPQMKTSGAANLQMITRSSQRVGDVRFVVVDNVDRFTRHEYWDRVVAVFVTGQAWQFKQYLWSDPNVLFQKVAGFCLTFQGDPIPPAVLKWNVDVIPIDRNERFRDREVSELIWGKIEKWMLAKGWNPRFRR